MTKYDMLKDKEMKTLLSCLCGRDYIARWARKEQERFTNVYRNLFRSEKDFERFQEGCTLSDD